MLKASKRKRTLALVSALALATGLAACSSGTDNGEEGSGDAVLTIGVPGDTTGLGPLGVACGPTIYCYPAYDSLVNLTAEGEYVPGLAESWEFADDAHQTLSITLREGLTFSDGAALTGEAASASMNSFRSAPGPLAGNAFPIDSVTATGDLTFDIHYAFPSTEEHALAQLTPQNLVGALVGPDGIADPSTLETASDGIGPYTLSADDTVKGSVYTYVANEDYYDQDAIKYEKIEFKPMPDANSRLNALLSGEIDWAQGLTSEQASQAEGEGFQVSTGKLGRSPAGVQLLVLGNRASGPLADERVRQAIQYAVPRDQIATAAYGDTATPIGTLSSEGDEGYDEDLVYQYPYDVDKAKELLTEAGYPDGITLTALDASFFDPGNVLGQALASSLADAGITLDLTTSDAPPGDVVPQLGQYDTFVWALVGGTFTNAYFSFSEQGGIINPYQVPVDQDFLDLVSAAAAAPVDEQADLMKEATARLDELSYAVPVASVPVLQVMRGDIENVPSTFVTYELDPFQEGLSG